MSNRRKGPCITIAGVTALSPDGLLTRLAGTDAWTLLFWRGLFFAAGLGLATLLLEGRHAALAFRRVGRPGLAVALLFTGSTICFVESILHTAVANTLVIVSATPLFAALLSRVLLGERILRHTVVAILVGMASIGFIVSGGLRLDASFGDLAAVGSALCLAGTFVVVRHAREVNMIPAMAASGIVTAVAAIPLAAPAAVGLRELGVLFFLGFVVLPVAFGLLTIGPRYLPAPEVSLVMLLETVLGTLWVWLALGEEPPWRLWIGGPVLLGTLVFHFVLSIRDEPAEARDSVRGRARSEAS